MSTSNSPAINIYIDTGRTFTDTLAADSDENIIKRVKILSSTLLHGMAEHIDEANIDIHLHEEFDFLEG